MYPTAALRTILAVIIAIVASSGDARALVTAKSVPAAAHNTVMHVAPVNLMAPTSFVRSETAGVSLEG